MKRDVYFDSLKFFLIFTVVYGHVLTIDYEVGSVNRAIRNFIYLFHMPLFIFISGRFSQIRDRKKYGGGILRLFETYVVFQIIHIFSRYFMHKGNFELEHMLVIPEMAMWYLLCLIYWRLMVLYILPKPINDGKKVEVYIILLSFIISLFAGFVPLSRELSFQRAFAFLPFFIMGYYSASVDIKKRLTILPFWSCLLVIIAIFTIFCSYFKGSYNFLYYAFPYNDAYDLWMRMVCICSAVFCSLLIMRLVIPLYRVASWGKCTLFIYMYHLFLEAVLKIVIVKGFLPTGIIPIFIYSVAITMFLIWAYRFDVLNVIMNPISYLISRKSKKLL